MARQERDESVRQSFRILQMQQVPGIRQFKSFSVGQPFEQQRWRC